ncbi:MAG: DUF971 domain-containing protein [Anaerolineales bacterium]|jgi:DUF971 family protein
MSKVLPTGITADRDSNVLIIKWNDGHTSNIDFSLLRHACPCAECRGGHEKMGTNPDPEVFTLPEEKSPRTKLVNIEAVGTYAITIEWEDGHHFGIYNWEYLRALCPCAICRESYGG